MFSTISLYLLKVAYFLLLGIHNPAILTRRLPGRLGLLGFLAAHLNQSYMSLGMQ